MNNACEKTTVLIAGGGPVGLSLAAELGTRGVNCILVEQDKGVNVHPRANVLQVRVQEFLRRWGIMDQVEAGGYPQGYPCDFVFTTRITKNEIFRFSFPSYHAAVTDTGPLTRQFPEIAYSPGYKFYIGQSALEPIIGRYAESFDCVQIRYSTRLLSFTETEDGVIAEIEGPDGRRRIRADYLVGCDGGRSTIRSQLGIKLSGMGEFGSNLGIYFRAPDFHKKHDKGLCALYWAIAPGGSGVFIPVDGIELFNLQRHLRPGETPESIDPHEAIEASFGAPLDAEILSVQPWSSHALVADKYRSGRVFLAGDAAHLFVPTGGFGMNTGIIDAVDLGIRIAGVTQGWMGPGMLDAYETERRAVAKRNALEAADNHFEITPSLLAPQTIEREDQVGDILREKYANLIKPQRKHFNAFGITLGYRYESPVIVEDPEAPPPDEAEQYTPSSYPGVRAPHAWISPGVSTLDQFGEGYTLLQFVDADTTELSASATEMKLPVKIVKIDNAEIAQLYRFNFVMVRPDGHVCWRGDSLPEDSASVLVRVSGFGCATARIRSLVKEGS